MEQIIARIFLDMEDLIGQMIAAIIHKHDIRLKRLLRACNECLGAHNLFL